MLERTRAAVLEDGRRGLVTGALDPEDDHRARETALSASWSASTSTRPTPPSRGSCRPSLAGSSAPPARARQLDVLLEGLQRIGGRQRPLLRRGLLFLRQLDHDVRRDALAVDGAALRREVLRGRQPEAGAV